MRAYLNTINNLWRVFDEVMGDFPFDLFDTANNLWRVFDEVMGDFPFDLFDTALRTRARRYPRVNVWESEDGLAVQAEVAGVEPDKLDVAVDANILTIKGEREQADGSRAEFQRSFNLPFELENDKIKATIKNGLLTVKIPRKPIEKRKIAIKKL